MRRTLVGDISNLQVEFWISSSISGGDLVVVLDYLRVSLLRLNLLRLRFVSIHHSWNGLFVGLRIITDELLVALDLGLLLFNLTLRILGFLEIILDLRHWW